MRDRYAWRKNLMRQLKPAWPDPDPPMTRRQLCELELGLFLAEHVIPGQPVTAGWAVTSPYRFVSGFGIGVDTAAQRMCQVASHLLVTLGRRRDWERQLTRYRHMPESVRGWSIDDHDNITRRQPSVAPDRFDTFARTLKTSAPFRHTDITTAVPGTYRVDNARESSSVTIPPELVTDIPPIRHDVAAREDRGPVPVTLTDLMHTAKRMDDIEETWPEEERGHWAGRVEELTFRVRGGSGFVDTDQLDIDGVVSLLGMVGAGKSTLMQLAAVSAAERGLHTTVVVADVLSCLRLAAWFAKIGVAAAPIVGVSDREKHLRRLERVHAETTGPTPYLGGHLNEHHLLSSACAIDGLREQPNRPWRYREAPCYNSLTDSDDNTSCCPIYAVCQRHHTSRALIDANVWLATPAGLISSRVPSQINPEQMRYLELAWRRSDLIIIDEADAVQTQLDAMFSPSQTLFGAETDSWLEELDAYVKQQQQSGSYAQFAEQPVREWDSALKLAAVTANRIYQLLPRDPLPRGRSTIREIIRTDCFSEWTLADKLIRAWCGLDKPDPTHPAYRKLREAFNDFLPDPLGEHTTSTGLCAGLVELAQALLGTSTETQRDTLVRQWLDATVNQRSSVDKSTLKDPQRIIADCEGVLLEFIVTLAVLSVKLNHVSQGWRAADGPLNLDGARGLLFQQPPDDYTPLIPAPVMGSVIGYQYHHNTEHAHALGQLRFFHCRGVGRYLLLNLDRLFHADAADGPAVLLMSGTSWAGNSPRYDIQIPPQVILQAPRRESAGVENTRFLPASAINPHGVTVSGQRGQQRLSSLRTLVDNLTRKHRGRPSHLEHELSILDEKRRRALLVVGSYDEAKFVATTMAELRPEWTGGISYLVRDDDDATGGYVSALRRGHIAKLARSDANVLVAPLLAIERGHNILNDEYRAAIGTAYFLVRPHPRPDDITYPVQDMNRWTIEVIDRLSRGNTDFDPEATSSGAVYASVAELADAVRNTGYQRWQSKVRHPLVYGSLTNTHGDKDALAWTQLVTIWQVIGRLVRGGVAARVYFLDAKFDPGDTAGPASLLAGMAHVLKPYFRPSADSFEAELAESLYGPLYRALSAYLTGGQP